MEKKLPLGIQNFEKIRNEGYLYIDKTEYVYKLAHAGIPYFMSRPRRFGKSLLVSTLMAYWEGKKELFTGLEIEKLEANNKDAWQQYPVFYFDFNKDTYSRENALEEVLNEHLTSWEQIYGDEKREASLPERFRFLIEKAVAKTGKNVVVLVDEYDKPLLDVITDASKEEHNKDVFKGFFSTLKSYDKYIKFVFFTGVTKFSKVSIFSDLNQLTDISINKEFAAICGITDKEIDLYLSSYVSKMSLSLGLTEAACREKLKKMYDGYHFHNDSPDIYNPYSLLCSLNNNEFEPYWFSTGTPTFLLEKIQNEDFDVKLITEGRLYAERYALLEYKADEINLIPLLYQTGYLTIKKYDAEINALLLDYPNDEVRYSFLKSLAPMFMYNSEGISPLEIRSFINDIQNNDLEGMRRRFESLFESLPYANNKDAKLVERDFQNVIYIVFILLGQFVKVEPHSANGRADCIVETNKSIFIFEFKVNKTAQEALKQIEDNRYLIPYSADSRDKWIIGANFSTETRNISEWEYKCV
ncbi:MAG: AAA family ATPase [Pseudobutyrivibrio ruminis]|uniref:ATP-binding protein n=1 Tax=Pseudobutyrivibrio ruminis TaxID=46206 RepID=UPI0026F1689B|nr:ATP-binding protein [Pseudobutyrivibrio ruminis]MBE5913605.1 AAA family ATPase [Pseudobutyrivibrio ruminis]